jgi:hypothetical protein
MLATENDLIGELQGMPLIIVLAMQRERFLQTRQIDGVAGFQRRVNAIVDIGGFNFNHSPLGSEKWYDITVNKKFGIFFSNLLSL